MLVIDEQTWGNRIIDTSKGSDILYRSNHGDLVTKKATSQQPTKPPGTVQHFAEAAECLKTLAHPVRLRIVQLLLHGRYTVGEIAEDCEIQDNVGSEHLRLLQRCGFLISEREGRKVYYRVAEPHLAQLMACIEGRFLPCGAKYR
jgi:ArsR family transcriptional regulator, zinc-responsive transcriptional repressor